MLAVFHTIPFANFAQSFALFAVKSFLRKAAKEIAQRAQRNSY
jgi:hypothetical protein